MTSIDKQERGVSEEDNHEGWISLNGVAARVIGGVVSIAVVCTIAFGGWLASTLYSADRAIDILVRQQDEQSRSVQIQLSRLEARIQRLEDRWPGWMHQERKD